MTPKFIVGQTVRYKIPAPPARYVDGWRWGLGTVTAIDLMFEYVTIQQIHPLAPQVIVSVEHCELTAAGDLREIDVWP
jgi:hypothetical protein